MHPPTGTRPFARWRLHEHRGPVAFAACVWRFCGYRRGEGAGPTQSVDHPSVTRGSRRESVRREPRGSLGALSRDLRSAKLPDRHRRTIIRPYQDGSSVPPPRRYPQSDKRTPRIRRNSPAPMEPQERSYTPSLSAFPRVLESDGPSGYTVGLTDWWPRMDRTTGIPDVLAGWL